MSFFGGFGTGLLSGASSAMSLYKSYQDITTTGNADKAISDAQADDKTREDDKAKAEKAKADAAPSQTQTPSQGDSSTTLPPINPNINPRSGQSRDREREAYQDPPADLTTVPHPESSKPAGALDGSADTSTGRERAAQRFSMGQAERRTPAQAVTDAAGDLGQQPAAPAATALPSPDEAGVGQRRGSPISPEMAAVARRGFIQNGQNGQNGQAAPGPTPTPASVSPAQGATGMINPAQPQATGGTYASPRDLLTAPPGSPVPGTLRGDTALSGTTPQPANVPAPTPATPSQPPRPALQFQDWDRTAPRAAPTPAQPAQPGPAQVATPSPATPAQPSAATPASAPAPAPTPPPDQEARGAPSLGRRLLQAVNPISSASAAEAPPGRSAAPAAALDVPAAAPAAAPSSSATPTTPTSETAAATPAPGTAPAVAQGKSPATTVVGTAPSEANQPPAARVELPVSRDAVVPNQASPTVSSERPPQANKPAIDPRPLAWLAKNRPEDAKLVQETADKYGITPQRLAGHWYAESRLKRSSPDGADGERGILQMMPSTHAGIDPQGQLNPSDYKQSLEAGAREIRRLDERFGQDSYSSVAAYQGGEGSANAIAKGDAAHHPRTVAYASAFFPGQNIRSTDITASANIDPVKAQEVANKSGPAGFLHYIANTEPAHMGLTDKWRAAEAAMMRYELWHGGGVQGMMQARDFVSSMAHQGSNQALMEAHQSMVLGDNYTAAQKLAKAHAFFPDGTMASFGLDQKGGIWAQRVDESDPSKPLGGPQPITLEGVQQMMIQTRDPNKYLQLVQQQQKTASELRFQAQHGQYYAEMAGMRRDNQVANERLRQDRLDETKRHDLEGEASKRDAASQREGARQDALSAAEEKAQAAAGQRRSAIDTETGKIYGPGSTTGQTSGVQLTTDQAAIASGVHRDLRANNPEITEAEAYRIGTGVAQGSMRLVRGQNGNYGVYSTKQGATRPEAVVSGSAGERIMHQLQPAAPQTSALGGPAARNAGLSSAIPSAAEQGAGRGNAPTSALAH